MGWQAGVFPGQDSTLICHKLLEQINILVLQGIHGKINFRFGPLDAHFRYRAPASRISISSGFICVRFAWHKLFDFPVNSVSAQERIVLFQLQFFGL